MKIGLLPFDVKHGRQIGSIGSSMIRCHWPVKYWDEAEIFKMGQKYDAVVFQKVYWEQFLDTYDGIKILDLADPDWLSNDVEIVRVAELFDAITCSSIGLTDYLKQIIKNKPIHFVPDRVDLTFFDNPKEHFHKAKTVAWFGYYHNAKEVLPQILPLLFEHNLKLLVISNNKFEITNTYGVEIENRDFSWDTIKYDLQRADILVNPLANKVKYKFKSSNKTLIAWACGLPVANSPDEIERFLDPKDRTDEMEIRQTELEEKWDCKLSIKQYMDIIDNYAKRRTNNKCKY